VVKALDAFIRFFGDLMAEHLPTGTAELGAPMDYAEHERTFDGFVMFTKLGLLHTIDTLLALALFAFGGGWGFWLGLLLLILATIALVIGLLAKGTVKPLVFTTILGVLLVAVSVG
jgi:hypothetical protein